MSEEPASSEDSVEGDPDAGRSERRRRGPIGSAAGLARIAAAAWWRTTIWTAAASVRVGSRVVQSAASGQRPVELFRSTSADVRAYARRVLGILDPEELVRAAASEITTKNVGAQSNGAPLSLRELGAELMRRSADVNFEEGAHPAYARILEDLAPDEGRILRLLALEGPQPSVDVRAGWLPLKATTELVAPGLNMIGSEAGCRHLSDVPAYLNNLFRLGLIWFSSEPVEDPLRYQVLEAQPEVIEAMRRAGRARTVRRSVELTPFGRTFCELCLPLETSELEALGTPAGTPEAEAATAPESAAEGGEPDPGEERDSPS